MQKLQEISITDCMEQLDEMRALYNRSFPKNERIPFERLLSSLNTERRMSAWFDHESLIGLSVLFMDGSLVYLAYLAIEESKRNLGYGSSVLHAIQQAFPASMIVIDIEEVLQDAIDAEQRRKRKAFYLHNRFQSTGVFYDFYQVHYELLSANGIITAEQYHHLICKHWGPIAKTALYRTHDKGEFHF